MQRVSRNGILAGGLWLIDSTKHIDHYPEPSRLAKILETVRSNGGGAFNLLVDLSRLQAGIPLAGVGLVGDDADGAWIRETARHHEIDTAQLHSTPKATTAFTDVMTEAGSGRRTFFYSPGANEQLGAEHFDFDATAARIFYLGYPGLLPRLDAAGMGGETGVVSLLRSACSSGMITAVDLVSAESPQWTLLPQALPLIDVLFANEWEAARLLGRTPLTEDVVTPAQLVELGSGLLGLGVRRAVVVHAPKGAVCLAPSGAPVLQGCVRVPASAVRGTCGAGDALAAGFLVGWHREASPAECLELGVCAAATCLHDLTSSGGVRPWQECLAYGRSQGFAPL
ncbi:ribokinase [Opitutaceae bacterium EW11]|nr:ribokinase [Opitutaceae bacterium EW11]